MKEAYDQMDASMFLQAFAHSNMAVMHPLLCPVPVFNICHGLYASTDDTNLLTSVHFFRFAYASLSQSESSSSSCSSSQSSSPSGYHL